MTEPTTNDASPAAPPRGQYGVLYTSAALIVSLLDRGDRRPTHAAASARGGRVRANGKAAHKGCARRADQ